MYKVNQTKKPKLNRSINYTKKVDTNKERGITLIALIITIIVLIILSAIVLRQITGDEGILTGTTTATRNYTIAEYKELVQQDVQGTILEKSIIGEEATLENLKDSLGSAENGFQTITKGDSITDVIVKTSEGYLFQVFYNEELGEYYVEYMGDADSSYIPEVSITYDETAGTISVVANTGNISKISITLNETEVATSSSNSLTYTSETSGTYKIAIETSEGLVRYGYVNVALSKDTLYAPTIATTAGTEGSNSWYRSAVNVEINPSETNGTSMHYRLVGATSQDEIEITDMTTATVITIENAGLTKVIAWAEYEEDGKTYKSDYSYYNVKIDNVNPSAPTASVTATEGNDVSDIGLKWAKSAVEIEITAEDENSGIYGYTYSITGTKNVSETSVIGKTQKITFETDGTFTLIIKAIDKAGNISDAYTLTVYKDSEAPKTFSPTISNITNTSFTISAYTVDDTSGIAKYVYYVNNEKVYEGTDNTYTVTGCSKDTTYGVYVVAYDNAGNIGVSSAISVYTSGTTSGGTSSSGSLDAGTTIGYGTYTLTYDSNGVSVTGLPSSRYFVYGETVTLTNDYPQSTQAGYNFYAWSTDPNAQDTLYYPGGTITGYGNITLYAIWTDKCTITFNANGGDYTPTSLSFYDGYSIVLPSNAGTYANDTGAELLGWAYTADNNFVYYKSGDVYNDYAHGSCTLYAVWDLGNTIYIDTNGGTYDNTYGDKVPLMFTFASGLGVTLPTDAGIYSSNTSITHFKWVLGSKTGTEYYEGGDYFSNTNADRKTLYAMWDNEIKFNANGGSTTPDTVYLRYGESITLPTSAGTNGSLLFDGWDTSLNAASGSLAPGSSYSTYSSRKYNNFIC